MPPKSIRMLLSGIFVLALALPAGAETLIQSQRSPSDLAEVTEVGSAEVAGVGPVRLTAQSSGTGLTLWAYDSAGKLIGEAHTVVGSDISEVYIRGEGGLESVQVRWADLPPAMPSE